MINQAKESLAAQKAKYVDKCGQLPEDVRASDDPNVNWFRLPDWAVRAGVIIVAGAIVIGALLYILEIENWEFLSEDQKNRLLPLLESSYSSFTDWMVWFVISEMLGEYFANEQAFQVLCRLKNIEAAEPRSLIPHGLEHIVKDSHDQQLAQKAYAELLQMKYDPSEQVRDEVNTSLQRIANRGIEIRIEDIY